MGCVGVDWIRQAQRPVTDGQLLDKLNGTVPVQLPSEAQPSCLVSLRAKWRNLQTDIFSRIKSHFFWNITSSDVSEEHVTSVLRVVGTHPRK
jgi:hypothetical protein